MRSTRKSRVIRGKPSHREDLRGELLAAAYTFVSRQGHEGLSMRKLAEDIGVSSGAPYHHFPDRRALLIAVAVEGYRRMFALDQHEASQAKAPRERVYRRFRNFLKFAVDQPRMFALMYESELVRPPLPAEIQNAQNEGFLKLHAEFAELAKGLSDRERSVRVATIWCAIYGFAMQSNRQMIRSPLPEPSPDELADKVVLQALRLIDP